MLNNIYEFQKIHLHTQRIMYFLPLVFIYFLDNQSSLGFANLF